MDTQVQFAAPNETTTEFVKIAAFREDHITWFEPVTIDFRTADLDLLHFAQVKVPVLDIRNAQVRYFDCLPVREPPAFRCPRLHLGTLVQGR